MTNPRDKTKEAGQMAPGSAILYDVPPAVPPIPGADSHDYIGVIRVTQAGLYWARAWRRTVKGRPVIELVLTQKHTK
jgi:hypothetical protein